MQNSVNLQKYIIRFIKKYERNDTCTKQIMYRAAIKMRGIITVIGKDTVGILAKVSGICAEYGVNVVEVTQSILQDMFCMIMLIDIEKATLPFTEFAEKAKKMGEEQSLIVHVMHEDVFNSMHRI